MGGGKRVYITRFGHPLSSLDLLPTLDQAESGECVSLAEQLSYHIRWMCSLLGEDYLANDLPVSTQATHESKLRAKGIVYQIDSSVDSEKMDSHTFSELVLGAWKVDDNGNIVEPFIPKSELPAPEDIDSSWRQHFP